MLRIGRQWRIRSASPALAPVSRKFRLFYTVGWLRSSGAFMWRHDLEAVVDPTRLDPTSVLVRLRQSTRSMAMKLVLIPSRDSLFAISKYPRDPSAHCHPVSRLGISKATASCATSAKAQAAQIWRLRLAKQRREDTD